MATPVNTYKTFLMKGTTVSSTTTYSKLVDIIDYPDEASVGTIDVTTLSDGYHHYIPDIKDTGEYTFTCNFDATDYSTLAALQGSVGKYAIWFGGTVSSGTVTPTGSEGKWEFEGYLTVSRNGGGVGEARQMTVSIAVTTDPVFSAS